MNESMTKQVAPGFGLIVIGSEVMDGRVTDKHFATLRDLFSGEVTMRSMSLVYTTLLSVVPLIAFSFSVLKGFGVHEALESANKEARLRYLRSLWTDEAEHMAHIEVLGGSDEASWTGIGSFRLAGKTSIEDARQLQLRLEQEFGIFSVVRKGLASGGCVRITPQVYNNPDEIGQLVDAMRKLAA